jgi:hypothetical protein
MKKMKKIVKKGILLGLAFSSSLALAQWEPKVRLSEDPAESLCGINNAWSIAASGNVIHAVYRDRRDGFNGEIYYKRSADGGTTWESDVNLSESVQWSATPAIAVSGSLVIATWDEYNADNMDIYYRYSTDGGVTWSAINPVSTDPSGQSKSSVAINGSTVHVAWTDSRNGSTEIYYKQSADGGLTWGTDTRLTDDGGESHDASLAVTGSNIHVAWRDNRSNGFNIWYKSSTDGGLTWGNDVQLTDDPANSIYPAIAASGNNVHVTWVDSRSSHSDVYYKRSTDGGVVWGSDTKLTTNDPYTTMYPSIAATGTFVAIAYFSFKFGESEISYLSSIDSGTTWEESRLTNDPEKSEGPSIAVSGHAVHVLWHQNITAENNYEIFYMRNLNGNPTDEPTTGLSALPGTEQFALAQNYPNPFVNETKIEFQLKNAGNAGLSVHDLFGKEVAVITNQQLAVGNHEYIFDASELPTGIYYYRLQVGNEIENKKMTVIK